MTVLNKKDLVKEIMTDLVKAYGEGSTITKVELYNPEISKDYPQQKKNLIYTQIERNHDYRLGWGKYLVTTSDTPSVVRDSVLSTLAKPTVVAVVKSNPSALAKAVLDINKKSKVVKKQKEEKRQFDNFYSFEGDYDTELFDTSDDDIEDILRNM